MMKNLFLFLVLGFGAMSFVSLSAQDTPPSMLYAKARSFGDSIHLRWAPMDYDTWQLGNEHGYKIYRTTYDASGLIVNRYELGKISVLPKEYWVNFGDNKYANVANQLIHGLEGLSYEGANGAFNLAESEDNRFSFGMFAADIDFVVSRAMALGFTDNRIDPIYTYAYEVMIDGYPSTLSAITPAVLASADPLEEPANLSSSFGNEEFALSWDLEPEEENSYAAYWIEMSKDGGSNFFVLNEEPFVYLGSEEDQEDNRIYFRDKLPENFAEFSFRVRGISIFGELGPYSAVVSGQGIPDPVPVNPKITEIYETGESGFTIVWTINESVADSVVGFNLYRTEDLATSPSLLNTGSILDPTTREYVDESPLAINYYLVEAIDANGNTVRSTAGLGQIQDTIPPDPPTGLTGVVDTVLDSVSVVLLTWNPNTEDDLGGYHVYTSNSPNVEFSSLTSSGPVQDTFYVDTISNYVLSDVIYYKIKAIDFRGNKSDFSDTTQVSRPDLVAPVPGQFKLLNDKSINPKLAWINSSSKDVVSNVLERRKLSTPGKWEVIYDAPKTRDLQILEEKTLSQTETYVYRIVSTDDAGLVTISDSLVLRPSVTRLAQNKSPLQVLVSKKAGIPQLEWELTDKQPIKKVIIYRSTDTSPMRLYEQIDPVDLRQESTGESSHKYRYFDQLYEAGTNCTYRVVVRFVDETNSSMSGNLSITE